MSIDPIFETDRGRVAGYCPFCREIRPFRVIAVAVQGVLDLMLRGYVGVCDECRGELGVDPGDYATLYDEPDIDLGALIERTNPALVEECSARSDLMQRIRGGRATPEEKVAAIREALGWLDHTVASRRRQSGPHVDLTSYLAFAGCVLINLLPVPLAGMGLPAAKLTNACTLGAILLAILGVWAMATAGTRKVRRRMAGEIADLLDGLDPIYDELAEALGQLRRERRPVARFIRPSDAWRAVVRRGAKARHPPG